MTIEEIKVVSFPQDRKLISDSLLIRQLVFVEEQGFSNDDDDGSDARAVHYTLYRDGKPVATVRLIKEENCIRLARMAVMKDQRGRGYGRYLVIAAMSDAQRRGWEAIQLSAQCHAKGFYESFGFTAASDVYIHENIPHVLMRKAISNDVYRYTDQGVPFVEMRKAIAN